MGALEEQDGTVVGVSWYHLSSLASSTSKLMNTSGSNCHTPVADMIKGAWLDILYLMDVLYVVQVHWSSAQLVGVTSSMATGYPAIDAAAFQFWLFHADE